MSRIARHQRLSSAFNLSLFSNPNPNPLPNALLTNLDMCRGPYQRNGNGFRYYELMYMDDHGGPIELSNAEIIYIPLHKYHT